MPAIVLNFTYMCTCILTMPNYSRTLNEKIPQLYNDHGAVCEFLTVGFIYMITALTVGPDAPLTVGSDAPCVLY